MALLVSAWFGAATGAMHAVLLGMLARMAFPLGFGLALHFAVPRLTEAGLFFYFLVFYPVVLTAETMLAVAHLPQDSSTRSAH